MAACAATPDTQPIGIHAMRFGVVSNMPDGGTDIRDRVRYFEPWRAAMMDGEYREAFREQWRKIRDTVFSRLSDGEPTPADHIDDTRAIGIL